MSLDKCGWVGTLITVLWSAKRFTCAVVSERFRRILVVNLNNFMPSAHSVTRQPALMTVFAHLRRA